MLLLLSVNLITIIYIRLIISIGVNIAQYSSLIVEYPDINGCALSNADLRSGFMYFYTSVILLISGHE